MADSVVVKNANKEQYDEDAIGDELDRLLDETLKPEVFDRL